MLTNVRPTFDQPRRNQVSSKIYQFLRAQSTLLFALLILALAALYINPLHETSISDDWSYILTSRHLFDTGNYHLHEWSSANLMFQAYWGVLFALLGGFSIGSLHVSTLVLLIVGMVSFYILAQDNGLSSKQAGLVTFCFVSNPVVLYLTFSFMTDVPSLSLLMLGLMFYTGGLRRSSKAWMVAGSLATVAAMFVRPTSLALLVGLGVIYWLDKDRISRWQLYVVGAVGPLIGGAFLLLGGTAAKFSGGSFNGTGEFEYIVHFDKFLANVLLWRPGMFLIYMGVFCMPLVIVAFATLLTGGKLRLTLRPKVVAVCGALVVGALLYNVYVKGESWTVPYMDFNLQALHQVPVLGWLVTLVAVPGGILFGAVIWERVGGLARWRALPLHERFVDVVTLFLLVYQLLFFNLGDRYLFVLLPFSMLVMGRYLQPCLANLQLLLITSGIIVIMLTAMITRFYQAEQEAEWKASDYALSLGANPSQIFGPWGWYCSYNFPNYLDENLNTADIYYMFEVWLPQRERTAKYIITDDPNRLSDENWKVVKTIPYNDGLFQNRSVYVIERA